MADNLYFGNAMKYAENGSSVAGYNKEGCRIIVASNQEGANRKFSRFLEATGFRNWVKTEVKILATKGDVPLEKRIEILKEVFEVIE